MPHKLTYLRYKLVSQAYTTHGSTLWRDAQGKWLPVAASGKNSALCTDGVIHFYDHPVLAVLFNPVHAGISRPRLLKIRTSRPVAHDGLKGGCKYARAVGELPVPSLSLTQIVEFGIRVALRVSKETSFRKWANGWLTDKDRSVAAAWAANGAYADRFAADAANGAATNAARCAAHAATNADRSAATAAATAAYYVAWTANGANAAYAAYADRSTAAAANSTRIFKSVLKTMNLYKLEG